LKKVFLLILFSSMFSLLGCGGGSSTDPSTSVNTTPSTGTTTNTVGITVPGTTGTTTIPNTGTTTNTVGITVPGTTGTTATPNQKVFWTIGTVSTLENTQFTIALWGTDSWSVSEYSVGGKACAFSALRSAGQMRIFLCPPLSALGQDVALHSGFAKFVDGSPSQTRGTVYVASESRWRNYVGEYLPSLPRAVVSPNADGAVVVKLDLVSLTGFAGDAPTPPFFHALRIATPSVTTICPRAAIGLQFVCNALPKGPFLVQVLIENGARYIPDLEFLLMVVDEATYIDTVDTPVENPQVVNPVVLPPPEVPIVSDVCNPFINKLCAD
jgi:hypothetical protein